MPLLSFVLVVHREQAYLRECAASVLDQGFADLELIAIDDASPDHAPELLDELAGEDARVQVRHLPSRLGRGRARNLGLELAAGEYLWFIETTDRLAPGAPAAVAERLAAAPDVLLVHHSRETPLGRVTPGPHRRLPAGIAGMTTLAEQPALAAAAPHAWDKVLRRELLDGLGARFGPAAHDELTVTWPALAAAERIAAEPTPVYIRREPENAVGDAGGSPFDVFAQYEAVLARGAPEALVAPAMLRHELALLPTVPARDRREFFARMSRAYRGAPVPGGPVAQLRARLVERDAYAAFTALEESLAARRELDRRRAGVERRGRRAVKRARAAYRQRHYRAGRRRPLDPQLAVFAAYWYRGYACNPAAIYEKARQLVPDMRGVWIVKPDAVAALPAGIEHVVAETPEYYDAIARASYCINNVNFPNHFVKREGSVHVMTHHGTPLKRMGLDERLSPVARMDWAALMRRCARWDYSVSANPHSTLVWERVYPVPYESLEVGYPRNDVLATATDDDVRRARAAVGIADDQVAVLYAPTHRDYQRGHVPVLDVDAVAEALGRRFVLLSRAHYFYAGRPGRHARDVSAHPSVEELCLAADVLMTDYSSIMFDYAVLDRPIVVHAPDWDVYRAIRGVYFDLMAEAPGAVCRTEAEAIEALRSGADDPAARAAFRERFCALEDGGAAERVVRRVWLGEPPKYSGARAADQRRRADLQRRGLPR